MAWFPCVQGLVGRAGLRQALAAGRPASGPESGCCSHGGEGFGPGVAGRRLGSQAHCVVPGGLGLSPGCFLKCLVCRQLLPFSSPSGTVVTPMLELFSILHVSFIALFCIFHLFSLHVSGWTFYLNFDCFTYIPSIIFSIGITNRLLKLNPI